MKILLATFALLSASYAFGAQNLTGLWTVHSNIVGNETDQECQLIVTDNKIAGTCKAEDKDHQVTGMVDAKKVTWQYESDHNGSPISLIYTAILNDSGKIAGTVEVRPFGVTGDFAATPGVSSSPSASSESQSGSPRGIESRVEADAAG
jgi:hypothetical protein